MNKEIKERARHKAFAKTKHISEILKQEVVVDYQLIY